MEENNLKSPAVGNGATEQAEPVINKDAQGIFISIKKFLKELLDFRDDTDRDATILAIKTDIPFKGATA